MWHGRASPHFVPQWFNGRCLRTPGDNMLVEDNTAGGPQSNKVIWQNCSHIRTRCCERGNAVDVGRSAILTVRTRFYPEFGFKGSLTRGLAEADQATTVCVTVYFLDPNNLMIRFRSHNHLVFQNSSKNLSPFYRLICFVMCLQTANNIYYFER